jgi:hypothetical protein
VTSSSMKLELPPSEEVRALWNRCAAVVDDEWVCEWLALHRIDVMATTQLDLARVLVVGGEEPEWCRYGSIRWSDSGYRLLIPLLTATGEMGALYARSLRPIRPQRQGSTPPLAGISGLVMANASARHLLRTGTWADDASWHTVIIAGGAADYLDWATSVAEHSPAVFGIVPGSWTSKLAARIPPGSRVIVRAHANPITGRYAHHVQTALEKTCEVIVRTAG